MISDKRKKLIEESANKTRAKLGFKSELVPSMSAALTKMEQNSAAFSIKYVPQSELGNAEAVMQNSDTDCVLKVSEVTVYKAKSGEHRSRFTLAHELGHYILDHPGDNARNQIHYADSYNKKLFEAEANLWAGYFLVPYDLSKECRNACQISVKFCVSMDMANIIHERNQKVRRGERGELRPLPDCVVLYLNKSKN